MGLKSMFFKEGSPKKPGAAKKEPEIFTSWDTAPMSWYRFLRVALWVPFALGILGMIKNLSDWGGIPGGFLLPFFLYDNLSRIFLLVSIFLAVTKLREKKWSGVIWLLVYFCVFAATDIVNRLMIALMYAAAGIDYSGIEISAGTILGCFLGFALIIIPNWIYFKKRRPMFFPYYNGEPEGEQGERGKQQDGAVKSNQTYRVCPNCASLVPSDQDVCSCGFVFSEK